MIGIAVLISLFIVYSIWLWREFKNAPDYDEKTGKLVSHDKK